MQNADELTVLANLETSAHALIAQNLRSKAVLLERLQAQIDRANKLGHMHATIHEVLSAAGLRITFDVYKTTLKRVRKRVPIAKSGALPVVNSQPAAINTFGSQAPSTIGLQEPKPESTALTSSGSHEPRPETEFRAGNAFAVKNALKEARAVAQIDFKKFAKRK